MSDIYRNKTVINQRGGSVTINNTTDSESIQLSHRSGSNILLNNLVNSELATNNKQTNILYDEYKTVGHSSNILIEQDSITRVGQTTFELKGFLDKTQIEAMDYWKETYREIANLNAKFKIKRGVSGSRADNPIIGSKIYTVQNKFGGYTGVPVRTSKTDDVAKYSKVSKPTPEKAKERKIEKKDIIGSAGEKGSKAPGVMEFGPSKSAATEGGKWDDDKEAQKVGDKLPKLEETLIAFESAMGDGGDDISFVKRNKFETIGGTFNDYPAVRIDDKGRSQPFEMLVSDKGAFKNHDYIPHIEEVDNSTKFVGGEETKVVSNKYNVTVGSGGINIKTIGCVEFGGATLKTGFKKININASHGIHIGSESGVEIQSLKTITLRTNRQVLMECSVGIRSNLIVGGGLYVEGETYVQHITAPLEVQQTENTTLLGKFATDSDRQLFIAECLIGGAWYPVFAKATDDLIINYPHSHHFNNLPLYLMESNEDVRKKAKLDGINKHAGSVQSSPQIHSHKGAIKISP